MDNKVYICLGSNSPDAPRQLALARQAIAALPGIEPGSQSSIYLTEPQGYAEQPWFGNQVLEIRQHGWNHIRLMRELLAIEAALGRIRSGPRYGPRNIDIDMLLFGGVHSGDPACILPHPRLVERAFALVPLVEIAPEIVIDGTPARAWLARLDWELEGDRIFQPGRREKGSGRWGNRSIFGMKML